MSILENLNYYKLTLFHSDDLEIESSFCKNFSCCGRNIPSLHELILHYEDSHIRHEESSNLSLERNANPLSRKRSTSDEGDFDPIDFDSLSSENLLKKSKNMLLRDEPSSDSLSAFDDTVLRPLRSQNSSNGTSINPLCFSTPSARGVQIVQQALGRYNESCLNDTLDHESLVYTILNASKPVPTATVTPRLNLDDSSSPIHFEFKLDSHSSEDSDCEDQDREGFFSESVEKPFACPVPGCNKSYKNPNGLKYHATHGHCRQKLGPNGEKIAVEKPYKCRVAGCHKRYKNPNGLKYHLANNHNELGVVEFVD